MELIKPLDADQTIPPSPELPDGVIEIKLCDDERGGINFLPNVVYDERDGETLTLQIIMPYEMTALTALARPPAYKTPLIVYVPGSAWHRQMVMLGLPNLIRVAEHGYAVAIVQYRPSEVRGFPAQIEDAKSAVRFMRKHADLYNIDTDKIAIWGDSSGGHTALMAGITGDGEPSNGPYSEYSSKVKCIVDYYGPTDISLMNYYPSAMDHIDADSPEGYFIGRKNVLDNPGLVEPTVVMNRISAETPVPPVLVMHGDQDQLVPFNQSVRLYNKLKEAGKEVEMYKLAGASHGVGGFHSKKAMQITLDFIAKHLN